MTDSETPVEIIRRGRIAIRDGDKAGQVQAIKDARAANVSDHVIRMLLRSEEVGL